MIKPKVIGNLVVYYLEPECTRDYINSVITYFQNNSVSIKSYKPIALLLSFLNVEFYDKSALIDLMSELKHVEDRLNVFTAIMEYDEEQFHELFELKETVSVSLFKSFEVSKVFFNVLTPSENSIVVIYDKDLEYARKIASYLIQRGTNAVGVNDEKEFKALASKQNNRFLIRDSYVDFIDSIVIQTKKNNIPIYILKNSINKRFKIYFNEFQYQKTLQEDDSEIIVFDTEQVIEITDSGIDYLTDLAFEAMQASKRVILSGLKRNLLDEKQIGLLEKSGIEFNDDLESLLAEYAIEDIQEAEAVDLSNLRKNLVSNFPMIVDIAFDTIALISKHPLSYKKHQISRLKVNRNHNLYGFRTTFVGDIKGTVVVIYSYKIAKLIIHEFINKDGLTAENFTKVSESFIMKMSNALTKKGVKINFSKPVVYADMDKLLDLVGNASGVFVDLEINKEDVYLFVTSPLH